MDPTSTPGKEDTRSHLILNNYWSLVKVMINISHLILFVLDDSLNFVVGTRPIPDNCGIVTGLFGTGNIRMPDNCVRMPDSCGIVTLANFGVLLFESSDLLWVSHSSNIACVVSNWFGFDD